MKFAYLVMAHHRFDVLQELISDLDDPRNDIFLHIDKKTKDAPLEKIKKNVKKAKLIIVDSMNVYWGDSTQISCVLKLLKSACKLGYHDYYHLMVGVEYPIISQDDIHNFFLVHKGKEFIGYDRADLNYLDRIRYYYFWNKYARAKNIVKKWLFLKGIQFVRLQKRLGINRIKNDPLEYKKGYANWSITDGLARFIVGQEDFIKIRMGRTHCADEVFFHTLAFNSPYAKNIYDFNNEYKSCMRLTTWKNSNNRFGLNDIDMILDSGKIFARKIDGPDALDLINAIKNRRRKTDKIL